MADSSKLNALAEAIEGLYLAFGQYEKPPIEHCVEIRPITDSARATWEKSLDEYTEEEIGDLARLSLVGFISDYPDGREGRTRYLKYWLPRLLQGLALGSSGGAYLFDDWYLLEQLTHFSKWLTWPAPEMEAIRNWCCGWLAACFAFPLDNMYSRLQPRFHAVACVNFGIGMGIDLAPAIEKLSEDLDEAAISQLQEVVEGLVPKLIQRQELDRDDGPNVPSKRSLLRWMLHPSTTERLEAAFFRFSESDPPLAVCASETLAWIEGLRKAYAADPRGSPQWLEVGQSP